LTKSGSKCKRSEKCRWHVVNTCPICFEDVSSVNKYPISCSHTFHEECLVQWFVHSDVCPVCRTSQQADKYIVFKSNLDGVLSDKYADAIRSLESDVQRLRRRLRAV